MTPQHPWATMMDRRHFLLSASALMLPSRARATVAPPREDIRPALAERFVKAGTAGTFVAYDADGYTIIASDRERSAQAILPASTFKIPNSVIALETGVVGDPDTDVFKWDGVTRAIPAWNRDHTLRSAIAGSAVPVYQEIARRIGAERMQDCLNRMDYGNKAIGGGIDRFWLTGDLRMSARSQQLVRDILPVIAAGPAILRYKTGLIGVDDRTNRPSIGWLVGWAEKGDTRTVFAMNMDIREPVHLEQRMAIVQDMLKDLNAI
jgi:beta-lactamase class D